jgi:hypothetical protein
MRYVREDRIDQVGARSRYASCPAGGAEPAPHASSHSRKGYALLLVQSEGPVSGVIFSARVIFRPRVVMAYTHDICLL